MKSNAFTLLEIIVAMLILSIVTAGTYGLFVTNYKFLLEAKHRLTAVNQAGMVLEKLRVYVTANTIPILPVGAETAFQGDINGDGNVDEHDKHLPSSIGLDEHPDIETGMSGAWYYLVSEVPDTNSECKKVTVDVVWSEP